MPSELHHAVGVLKRMADLLQPHAKTVDDEADLSILKQHVINFNGYELDVYYTKEHHAHFDGDTGESQEFDLLILQIYSKYFPFIPFKVLLEVAKPFLGDKELALSEFVISGRKLYMWSVALDVDGTPSPVPEEYQADRCRYDDVDYVRSTPIIMPMPKLS